MKLLWPERLKISAIVAIVSMCYFCDDWNVCYWSSPVHEASAGAVDVASAGVAESATRSVEYRLYRMINVFWVYTRVQSNLGSRDALKPR